MNDLEKTEQFFTEAQRLKKWFEEHDIAISDTFIGHMALDNRKALDQAFKAGQKIQGDIIVDLATKEYNAGFSSGSATTIAKIREGLPKKQRMDVGDVGADSVSYPSGEIWTQKKREGFNQTIDLIEKTLTDVENDR